MLADTALQDRSGCLLQLLTFTKVRKEGDIGGDIPKGCTPLASKSASPLPIASVHLFPTTAFGPEGTSLQGHLSPSLGSATSALHAVVSVRQAVTFGFK